MYKETLEILMEGIDDPIKEQLLKNQLEYHFKNKTPENKAAIDNTTTIVRRMLEDFEIMDLIAIQPIAPWNPNCDTIRNDEKYDVEIYANGLYYHEIPDLQDEINNAIASELSYSIAKTLTETMFKHAPATDNIIIDIDIFMKRDVNLVKSIMSRVEEVNAKWVVISLCELALIRLSDRYTQNVTGFKMTSGVSFDGLIDGEIRVYTSLHTDEHILIGSSDDENPPIVYAPETLLVVDDYEKDANRFPLLTSAETFIDLDAIEERYRKVRVVYQNNQEKSKLMVDF